MSETVKVQTTFTKKKNTTGTVVYREVVNGEVLGDEWGENRKGLVGSLYVQKHTPGAGKRNVRVTLEFFD